jgi:hypothetical protein
MTQIDFSNGISNVMNFEVTGIEKRWTNYGVTQYFGAFEGKPKRYQVVSVKLPTGTQNFVRSPGFNPVPTAVAQEIVHYVAKELNMTIKDEYNNGLQYLAQLVSQIKGEVEPGDIVAWGIAVRHNVVGSFRIDTSLLRLVCSNGLMDPVDSKIANIEKSYDIEKMKESFLSKAQILQDMFEEELERFRQFKRYKMNKDLAEKLAKKLPKPIIQDIIIAGKNKTVISFSDVDLWTAYNAITNQISNKNNSRNNEEGNEKKLKLTTKFDFGFKVTRIFEEHIAEQEAQISS